MSGRAEERRRFSSSSPFCSRFWPRTTLAQAETSAAPDEVRAVFLRATELYEGRSYAREEVEFRRAWELMEGHPRLALVLVNIGRCVESQPAREAEALELSQQALAQTNALAANDAGIRDARRIAEERIAELNARLVVQAGEPPTSPSERETEDPLHRAPMALSRPLDLSCSRWAARSCSPVPSPARSRWRSTGIW